MVLRALLTGIAATTGFDIEAMKLSICGAGYVGLVSGACMVVDLVKINKPRIGILPRWEPNLEVLVDRNTKEGRLIFTTDMARAVQHGLVKFIAVGTPPDEDSSADVQALAFTAQQEGYNSQILKAEEAVNNRQKTSLFVKLAQYFCGATNLLAKTIVVWGMAFKPNTDDIRTAPSRTLMEALLQVGTKVQAFDPVAMTKSVRIFGHQSGFSLYSDKYANLLHTDTLVSCAKWQQFRAPDIAEMQSRMRAKVIVDGRNLYQPHKLKAEGGACLSVGRFAK